ncbi:hypothetical protein PQ465_17060 [Sphingobacterium oryzagri]|uniref:Acyl carrier protein phosphodiesterase n=1 Tax=Sphingobacterium oryzagri TaxID=3025669 RepID=A0ABY7WED7_9SPHI|nr:hypothetical protein [Sphingobacterium sp. KACC 22765]WDF67999.1 hypothetical protein PQ465_17060 [Sphingobacterium sp. KACC 22765]
MNFLSHYYFERYSPHSESVLGGLLPDLLKNVDKQYNFHPQRFEDELLALPQTRWISEGWYRHVEVDKIFHGSPFFLTHCHVLRKLLDPIVAHLPIRASFLAHISIELLLDHLLIAHNNVNVARLYEHLEQVPGHTIAKYLRTFDEVDVPRFLAFYERFLSAKYIFEYKDIHQVSHALFNICKRVWVFENTTDDVDRLTACLLQYKEQHLNNYLDIYHYIQDNMA